MRVLLALAAVYNVALNLTQAANDTHLTSTFKRMACKVHPDKGGEPQHAKDLHRSRQTSTLLDHIGRGFEGNSEQ